MKITERITFVDCLRGYALMGLFLIHMVEYYEIYWRHPQPGPVNTITFALFGGKAYAIFALLFGLSFFIILERQAQRGVDFRARFAWRVSILLLMGYLHGLLYGGDILQVLAVAGFVILPLWTRGNRVLLAAAFTFLLQLPTIAWFGVVNASMHGAYAQPFFLQYSQPVYDVYANGGLADVLGANAWQGLRYKWAFMIESGRFSNVIGLALLGCYLGRIGFFTDVPRYRRVYARAWLALVAAAAVLLPAQDGLAKAVAARTAGWLGHNVASICLNTSLAGASALLLLLVYQSTPGKRLLGLLAPPGRMSLTVYVSQSLLCVPFFYGFGSNAHAWIGQVRSLALGLALWSVLVALAHAWLRHFHYGPLEWVWRALTLADRRVPFRRRMAPAGG
jgi:uncharacterized protein